MSTGYFLKSICLASNNRSISIVSCHFFPAFIMVLMRPITKAVLSQNSLHFLFFSNILTRASALASNVNNKKYSQISFLSLFLYRSWNLSHTTQSLSNTNLLREDKEDALRLRPTWLVAGCILGFFVVINNSWNCFHVVFFLFNLVLMDVFDAFSTSSDSASVDLNFQIIPPKFVVTWIPMKIMGCSSIGWNLFTLWFVFIFCIFQQFFCP